MLLYKKDRKVIAVVSVLSSILFRLLSFSFGGPKSTFCKIYVTHTKVEDIIEFCKNMLQQDFCSNEYKELSQLALLYMNGQSSITFKIHRSGPIHNAVNDLNVFEIIAI